MHNIDIKIFFKFKAKFPSHFMLTDTCRIVYPYSREAILNQEAPQSDITYLTRTAPRLKVSNRASVTLYSISQTSEN